MIPFPSSSFASSQVATCRRLASVAFTMDPALAGGTYYLCILANGLLPTPGTPPVDATNLTTTAGLLLFCLPFVHAPSAAETVSVNAADYGFVGDTGWRPSPSPPTAGNRDTIERLGFMFYISTTVPTSCTSAGAHVWTNATGS